MFVALEVAELPPVSVDELLRPPDPPESPPLDTPPEADEPPEALLLALLPPELLLELDWLLDLLDPPLLPLSLEEPLFPVPWRSGAIQPAKIRKVSARGERIFIRTLDVFKHNSRGRREALSSRVLSYQ